MIKGIIAGLVILACAGASMTTLAAKSTRGSCCEIHWKLDACEKQQVIWGISGSNCCSTVLVHINEPEDSNGKDLISVNYEKDGKGNKWGNGKGKDDDCYKHRSKNGVFLEGCGSDSPIFVYFGQTVQCRVCPSHALEVQRCAEDNDGDDERGSKESRNRDICGTAQLIR